MGQDLPMFSNILDARLDHVYAPLCCELPQTEMARLPKRISKYLEEIREALKLNEFLDIQTAERIAQTLISILNELDQYPAPKCRLITGAVFYFIRNQDAQADLDSILGFDDDVAVLNYVLVDIGRSDLRIEL